MLNANLNDAGGISVTKEQMCVECAGQGKKSKSKYVHFGKSLCGGCLPNSVRDANALYLKVCDWAGAMRAVMFLSKEKNRGN